MTLRERIEEMKLSTFIGVICLLLFLATPIVGWIELAPLGDHVGFANSSNLAFHLLAATGLFLVMGIIALARGR